MVILLQIKCVKKKSRLILGVTTDLFFEVSKPNLISKLLTFIHKKWGTVHSDFLPGSRIMGKNVKEIKSKNTSFRKKFCQKNCQVLQLNCSYAK